MINDKIALSDGASANAVLNGGASESFSLPRMAVRTECMRVVPAHAAQAGALLRRMQFRHRWAFGLGAKRIERELIGLPRERAWIDESENIVTTQGRNSVLDVYLRAQTQITSWFLGLISSVSYTAVAATDTAAGINGANGWREAGAANAPTYSGVRKTLSFSAASGGSITTSSAASFTAASTAISRRPTSSARASSGRWPAAGRCGLPRWAGRWSPRATANIRSTAR